jgi:putative intracellular protease/amidase
MDIVILLYEKFTALDAVGPYEVLRNLPGAKVTFVAKEVGPVRTDSGALAITADAALRDVTSADVVVIPGGPGQADFMQDEEILSWLRAIDQTTQWTTSVCTGSLLLGAAGLLEGKEATSHWTALDHLPRFGATPTLMRVVEQGKVITAAGVSAGIDMGLRLAAKIAGDDIAQAIQLGIEYDPQPPFDSGSPAKAPQHLVDMLKDMSRFAVPEEV